MDRRTEVVIAGYGYVGRAYESLLKKVNPRICDPKLNTVPLNHNDFDAVIICVNTPTVDGQCDISNVIDVIKQNMVEQTRRLCVVGKLFQRKHISQ